MLHFWKKRTVTSSWLKMFLGTQHAGCWPRHPHCFSLGWVSGQSGVMQNLQTKTSEQKDDERWWVCCHVGMISLVLFQQLSCTCFHFTPLLPIQFSFLIFPFCLVSHHSLPCHHLALLPSLCPWSNALTWPYPGKTLQSHISCRKSRWVSRQAQSVASSAQRKELGLYPKAHFLVHHVAA